MLPWEMMLGCSKIWNLDILKDIVKNFEGIKIRFSATRALL